MNRPEKVIIMTIEKNIVGNFFDCNQHVGECSDTEINNSQGKADVVMTFIVTL